MSLLLCWYLRNQKIQEAKEDRNMHCWSSCIALKQTWEKKFCTIWSSLFVKLLPFSSCQAHLAGLWMCWETSEPPQRHFPLCFSPSGSRLNCLQWKTVKILWRCRGISPRFLWVTVLHMKRNGDSDFQVWFSRVSSETTRKLGQIIILEN